MSVQAQSKWVTLKFDNDYEICTEYPFPIRRKYECHAIKEWIRGQYITVKLNGVACSKHRLIAFQWIKNDDPDNKTQVDHINHDKTDNHPNNLRWVTPSQNSLNRTGRGDIKFEYVDDLPIDVVPIILYKNWEFEGYFIDQDGDVWFDTGANFRKIRVSIQNTVRLWDINHKRHNIGIKGLRREFL